MRTAIQRSQQEKIKMPQPERTCKYVDTTRSPLTAVGMDQFVRPGPGRERMSPSYSCPSSSSSPLSPYFERLKSQDAEDDQGLYQKKSVLAKMKEKAKKFRNSLNKRRQEDDGNLTPSWGVSLDDEEEQEEQDAEYLGAPMYESELAPEGYKENARQHPRADPVISEKHVLQSANKSNTATTQPATSDSNKTMSETIAEKLTPNFGGGSNEANPTSSKTSADYTTHDDYNNMSSQTSSSVQSTVQNSSYVNASTNQKDPKVKDYLINNVEPREDEKTMPPQKVICETITIPSGTTRRNNAGVMDKVKGAVNSLIGNEEPSQEYAVRTAPTTTTTRASSQLPEEVDQEENHGRILQTN